MEGVRDAALRLASGELGLTDSVAELCGWGSIDVALLSNARGGDHQEMTEGVWLAVLSCCSEGNSPLLSSTQRTQLSRVLHTASGLLDNLLFSPQHFLRCLAKQLECVPLEVVFSLHTANIVPLELFLQTSGATAVEYLAAAVVRLSFDGPSENQRTLMHTVAEVVCDLVARQCSEAVKVVERLPAFVLGQSGKSSGCSFLRAVPSTSAAPVGSIMINSHLAHPASSKLEAVPHQILWQYCSLPQSTTSFYSDLLSLLETAALPELLQRALSVEQLNWSALLQIVACFLHHDHTASEKLTGLVRDLVMAGLDDGDSHLLGSGLLVARQASLEGSHIFPSYDCWLQAMFGDGSSSVIRGKKELVLLLKTLTTFVPHDPLFALKAHVAHPPRRVTKYLSQINDYVSLVSTRLHDLGEMLPSAGQNQNDATSDAEQAIKHYRQTGRIPHSVTEASIFKQPYFLGRFLPSLLRPSLTISGDREEFISALAREKLIPPRMMRRYERTCQEMKDREPIQWSGDVSQLLGDLPAAVKGGREGAKLGRLLSHLSSCLSQQPSLQLYPLRALQLVEEILSVVCKTLLCLEADGDTDYRWVADLLAMLSAHRDLHEPLYHRLAELLTTQLEKLSAVQLLSIAVLLSQAYCLSPLLARVEEEGQVLETGRDYSNSLLSHVRHSGAPQFLRFGCLFMEQICQQNAPLPTNLLCKMVYMYRREKLLYRDHGGKVLQAVERLLLDNLHFSEQWHNSEVCFEDWLCWELEIDAGEDGLVDFSRQCYRWSEVYGKYLQSASPEELFRVLFKTLVYRDACADFLAILQELTHILLRGQCETTPLLDTLQSILGEKCSSSSASSVRLALCLSPTLLFSGSSKHNVQLVAHFLQHTLAPQTEHMMTLPLHITHYLVLGAHSLPETEFYQLCDMSPTFLASLMVHWPRISHTYLYTSEAAALSKWIHSGMETVLPPTSGPALLPYLAVGVWHYLTQLDDPDLTQLSRLPAEAIVIVTLCSVHWLADSSYSHPLSATVERILQVCVELQPSAVEVFCDERAAPDYVTFQHSQTLADFRSSFGCKPSSDYNVVLLKLARMLPVGIVNSLLAETCFLWLCVRAHAQCFNLSAPLPTVPPPAYCPLSVRFIEETETALVGLLERASSSQLQSVLENCHSKLKPVILSVLNRET